MISGENEYPPSLPLVANNCSPVALGTEKTLTGLI